MKPESTVSSQNSDEDLENSIMIKRDRRRELHTQAEQRRRDAIKNGYDSLLPLIQTNSGENNGTTKLSKATILQRTLSHIRNLTEQTSQKEKELENLKNELLALKIMNSNYEAMAKGTNQSGIGSNSQGQPGSGTNQSEVEYQNQVPEHVKFEIFRSFMMKLFESFDNHTKFDNLPDASETIIHWVEEFCKPQYLNQSIEHILTDALSNCCCTVPSNLSPSTSSPSYQLTTTTNTTTENSPDPDVTFDSNNSNNSGSTNHIQYQFNARHFPTPTRRQTLPLFPRQQQQFRHYSQPYESPQLHYYSNQSTAAQHHSSSTQYQSSMPNLDIISQQSPSNSQIHYFSDSNHDIRFHSNSDGTNHPPSVSMLTDSSSNLQYGNGNRVHFHRNSDSSSANNNYKATSDSSTNNNNNGVDDFIVAISPNMDLTFLDNIDQDALINEMMLNDS